jgi:hypothetical protein
MADRKPVKVVIGTPCYTGTLDAEVAGRMGMYLHRLAKTNPEITVEWHIMRRSFVHIARNNIVNQARLFGADYLWWVDDDCVLPQDLNILPRLIDHDKDIVIVPYFLRVKPHRVGVLNSPDIEYVEGYKNIKKSDLKKGLVEVSGGGTHCMLVNMKVYDAMELPWFALPEYGGTEDMYMCLKAKRLGFGVWCDTDIEAGHVGYAPVITSKDCIDENEN